MINRQSPTSNPRPDGESEDSMDDDLRKERPSAPSRREFLKGTAASAAVFAAGLPAAGFAHAQGSETIRVGLIGCGGRGGGAAEQIVRAAPGVRLEALGDLYRDRLDAARYGLAARGPAYQVRDDHCFTGFDAYQRVLECGVDLVILATPPVFRSLHLEAAVKAGKHAFVEKPIATCPAGVRAFLGAAKLASQKGLAIVAGTQRRHQASYVETIKRIHGGAIGKVLAAQCYWMQGGIWNRPRKPEYSDMEWQTRNWYYFTWISGDHIVEQHVHNLDVINWVMGSHPVKCTGMGGRQSRTDPVYGNIYDHFTTEYEYPGGVKVLSMCRQVDGCANRVSESVIGSQGTANPAGSLHGATPWRFEGQSSDPYVQELTDLIGSIRAGRPLNEAQAVAESTLTAIMGRMSAYTGQEVTWEQALASKLDLRPAKCEFGPLPAAPVAIPGQTPLI
jgi:predicted dehydrogenase